MRAPELLFGRTHHRVSRTSHLAMRGVPLKAVQELMGHATMEMTMRYAHLSPHVPRDAVKLLDHGGRLGNGWAKTERSVLNS